MPRYDFVCRTCGEVFEKQIPFAEYARARPACPACHGRRVRRQIGPVAQTIKQAGWLTREQMETAVGLTEALTGHTPLTPSDQS